MDATLLSLVVLTISAPFSSAFPLKKCILSSLDGAMCPPNSYCLQRSNGDIEGDCVCKHSHIINALYTSPEDYCLMDYATISTTEDVFVHREMLSVPDTDHGGIQTPHHHIIGGILIPLVLVTAFVSGAYFVVRYRVFQRLREHLIGRRRRPTYQDVMLATEFDPPLI